MRIKDCVLNTRIGYIIEGGKPTLYTGTIVSAVSDVNGIKYVIIDNDGSPLYAQKLAIKTLFSEADAKSKFKAKMDEFNHLEKEFAKVKVAIATKVEQAIKLMEEVNQDLKKSKHPSQYYPDSEFYNEWNKMEITLRSGGWLPSQSC